MRFLAQQKAIAALVGGGAHGARDEPVERVRLVGITAHQAVERGRNAGRAVAGEVEDVQRVEREEILVVPCDESICSRISPPTGAFGST